MALSKYQRRIRVRKKIRKHISGTAEQPRLSVFRSNKHIYAQIIDDVTGKTLVAASSQDKEVAAKKAKNKTEIAEFVGEAVAKKATEAGIEVISFDRGGYLYHGRVKALADSARKSGLKF